MALRAGAADIRDAFSGTDRFPIPYLGPWILRDLFAAREIPTNTTATAERALFVAGFLLALRTQASAAIADETAFADVEHMALVDWCDEELVFVLAPNIPPSDDFWARLRDLTSQNTAVTAHAGEPAARHAVPATVVALAGARLAGVDDDKTLATLRAAIVDVTWSFQIRQDIASIQRDALSATMTYPIAVICRAADLPLEPVPAPDTVIGAMLVTGSLEKLLAEAASCLTAARKSASDLGLPTLCGYIEDVAVSAATKGPTILVSSEPAPLPKAIDMAAAFLDADRMYSESWEVHREGMFGAELVVSRFPAALTIELQRRAGRAMDDEIDDILDYIDGTAFRYYDHLDSDIDTDTVGIYLRLAGPKANGGRRTPNLERALGCLSTHVASTGQVPVWLVGCGHDFGATSVTLGEGCGTVAAHLLLGLAELTDESARTTLTTGANALLARIRDVGLGANVDYPPLFAATVFFLLLRRLDEHADRELLRLIDESRSRLMNDLETFANRPSRTAQEAALTIGACWAADRMDLVEPAHVSTILKHQRFDGGWPAETFAMAPNRGQRASPYSSSILTTALCHAALVTVGAGHDAVAGRLLAQARA